MKIDHAYSNWAASYDSDRNLTQDLDQALTAELWGAQRRGLIVEAGCGTGKNTEIFAATAEAVLALDFSPGMLARARERVKAPGRIDRPASIYFAGKSRCQALLQSPPS